MTFLFDIRINRVKVIISRLLAIMLKVSNYCTYININKTVYLKHIKFFFCINYNKMFISIIIFSMVNTILYSFTNIKIFLNLLDIKKKTHKLYAH